MTPTGLAWCAIFFLLGPSLILVNNYVFNTVHYKFPILFSSLGVWGTAILCQGMHRSGFIEVHKKITPHFWVTRILPIGMLSAATIGAGNSVYLYLSVSFTQMLKALTPVYILLCLVLFKVEIPKREIVFAVVVISVGTIIASLGELRFSWVGFIIQSLADLFEGSRLVLLQLIMTDNAMTPMESIFFTSPATAIGQLILVLIYEREALLDSRNWAMAGQNWFLFLAGIVMGMAINFVGMFVIKHTSGLMLKLIGVVRNNCLVLVSVLLLGERTTFMQTAGYILSIAGFVWYAKLTSAAQSEPQKPSGIECKYSEVETDEEELEEL